MLSLVISLNIIDVVFISLKISFSFKLTKFLCEYVWEPTSLFDEFIYFTVSLFFFILLPNIKNVALALFASSVFNTSLV